MGISGETEAAGTIVDTVVKYIRESIQNGDFKIGDKLKEVDICSRLNVSRTPVREAFRLLEMEGVLVHNPNRGVSVTDISTADFAGLQELRGVIECMSARLAAMYITDREVEELKEINRKFLAFDENKTSQNRDMDDLLHMRIAEISRNVHIVEFKKNIQMKQRAWDYFIPFKKERIPQSYREHEDIIRALEQREPSLAEKYMEIHFIYAVQSIRRKMEELKRKQV